jgi:hypothetical protein
MKEKKIIEDKIKYLERIAYLKSARYAVLESFVELILTFVRGVLYPEHLGQEGSYTYNSKAINKYYSTTFPVDNDFGIREGKIRIANRAVSKQIIVNALTFEFSPSIAIFRAWSKSNAKFHEFHYATDHPQVYAFIMAIRDKCDLMHYYQHGWYTEKEFWHMFSEYDIGHTVFKVSYDLLLNLYPDKKLELHSMPRIATTISEQNSKKAVIILPEFRFANALQEIYMEHARSVIEELLSEYERNDLYLRFHPLDRIHSSKCTAVIRGYGIQENSEPLGKLLNKVSKIYLLVPSTLKYEVEASEVEVVIKKPKQLLISYPLLF